MPFNIKMNSRDIRRSFFISKDSEFQKIAGMTNGFFSELNGSNQLLSLNNVTFLETVIAKMPLLYFCYAEF